MSISSQTRSGQPPVTAHSAVRSVADKFWAPALIVLAVAAAYANGLRGPYVLDDITSIRDNPTIRTLWPPWQALSPPPGEGLTPNGRPLVNLSLAVNRAISGDQVWSYHLFNVLVHALAALALYGVARRTLAAMTARAGGGSPRVPALAIALLWALHPLQTESVTYIVQRAESMMGLFFLVTLYCFIRYADSDRPERVRWAALAVLACLCGMASKEVMVGAPIVALLYDRAFLSGTFAESWRRHRGLLAALALTWLLLAYEVSITGSRGGTAGFGAHVAWWRYAITQFPAIAHYLRLCFWPHPLVFDYGMGLAFQTGRVVPYAIVILSLLAGTAVLLLRAPRLGPGPRAVGFLGGWFFIILAPTSSVVPVATQTMAEHRMYLPLAAVVALVVVSGHSLLVRRLTPGPRQALAAALALGVLAAALAFLTIERNRDYRSNIDLWTATVRDYPKNMRALYNLGVSLTEADRIEEAVRDYEIVVKTQPDYIDAHHNLANGLVKLGRVEESLVHYEAAVGAHPDSPDIQCSLGIALLDTDRVEQAIKHLREALKLKPGLAEANYQLGEALLRDGKQAEALGRLQVAVTDRPKSAEVRNALGNAFYQLDRPRDAAQAYREAIAIDANIAEPHNNLGNLLLQTGHMQEAVEEFRAALRAKPDFAEARNNLGSALLDSGMPQEAAAEFKAAVALKPDSADARYNLANCLAKIGSMEDAAAQYREALRIRPDYAEAHNNLGIVLVRLDQPDEAESQFSQALRARPDYAEARDNLSRLRQARPAP